MNNITNTGLVNPSSINQFLRRFARGLLVPMIACLTIQPLAMAAPSPSKLAQMPMFVDAAVPSNVAFIVDDSFSMSGMTLPMSPDIKITAGSTVTIKLHRNPLKTRTVDRDDEWIFRSPTLNPQYYNPAITYKPWNDNGKSSATTRMPSSNPGMTPYSNGFREGLVRHDMRLRGPNYLGPVGFSLNPKDTDTGANATAGGEDWFFEGKKYVRTVGTTNVTANQDIFSKPFVAPMACAAAQTRTQCEGGVLQQNVCSGTTVSRESAWRRKESCTQPGTLVSATQPPPLICNDGKKTYNPNYSAACPTDSRPIPGSTQCCTGSLIDQCIGGTLTTQTAPVCVLSGCRVFAENCLNSESGKIAVNEGTWTQSTSTHSDGTEKDGTAGLVLARYYRYVAPASATSPGLAKADPANYLLVEVDRDAPGRMYDVYNADGVAAQRDCVNPSSCTFAEESQNFANWYTYYRTRLFTTIAVSADALSKLTAENGLSSLRIGYGSINYFPGAENPFGTTALPANVDVDPGSGPDYVGAESRGALVRGVRPFTEGSPERSQVFDWLFSLRESANTPNREALDSVGRYFSRRDSKGPWSEDPGVGNSIPRDKHISCRRNFAILLTDGEWTRFTSSQPLIETRTTATPPPWWVQEVAPSTPRNARNNAGPLLTGQGGMTGMTYKYLPPPSFQVDGNPTDTLTDVAVYYWSRDLRPDLPNNLQPPKIPGGRQYDAFWQNLIPYIVGYGITATYDNAAKRATINNKDPLVWPPVKLNGASGDSIPNDRDDPLCNYSPLTTSAGGVVTGNPNGCGRLNDTMRAALAAQGDFLAATDVATLAYKIGEAFRVPTGVPASGTGVTARSGRLSSGDSLYFASFISGVWSGELTSYDAVDYLDALKSGSPLPDPKKVASFPSNPVTARSIFTTRDDTNNVVPFLWDNLSSTQKAALSSQSVLNYLRGDQSNENNMASPMRPRASLLGDIVNSDPLYSKARNDGYSNRRTPAGGGGGDYKTYVDANALPAGRAATIFVGANDGMFHAFDADTLQERFAYVPKAMYPYLKDLSSLNYRHRYFVDGPVVEGDVFIGGAWKTVVVGTGGAGPVSVFGLNVTDPTSLTASKVLFDLTRDSHPDLGHITKPGWIGSAKDGKWYYFVGNGFESTNDKARLLAINLADPSDIVSIATDGAGGPNPDAANWQDRPNGLGGITPVYDQNRNIVAIYGGDRLGRMWKFDLSSTSRSGWKVATTGNQPLFEAKDAAGNRQPITAAPRIAQHPAGGSYVIFGTGSFVEDDDKADKAIQTVYGIWEKPGSSAQVTKPELLQLNLATVPVTDPDSPAPTDRKLNNTENLNWKIHNGWYFNLSVGGVAKGERVVASPTLDSGYVQIMTFAPVAGGDPCSGAGESFFYRIGVANNIATCSFANKPCDVKGVNVLPNVQNRMIGRSVTSSTVTPGPSTPLTKENLTALLASKTPGTDFLCPIGTFKSITNKDGATPAVTCAAPPLRTWRELPRRP